MRSTNGYSPGRLATQGYTLKSGLARPAVERLATALAASGDFDDAAFVRRAMRGLSKLELKDRVIHIAKAIDHEMPDDIDAAFEIAYAARRAWPSEKTDDYGFAAWPLIDWVPMRGFSKTAKSLKLLERLTSLFSAEFAIRPFLEHRLEQTVKTMERWTKSKDEHVRRLVSEGTRPLLPWAPRVRALLDDPSIGIDLIRRLDADPSEYVRRSVANHLNDISKNHPDLALEETRRLMKGASEQQAWIVRHALRTLVKRGDPQAMTILGFSAEADVEADLVVTPTRLQLGGTLELDIELRSTAKKKQRLVVDYAVHFVKANGSTAPKVFKLKTVELDAGETVTIAKRQSIRPISTRKYYPGRHRIELLVAGKAVAEAAFDLRT